MSRHFLLLKLTLVMSHHFLLLKLALVMSRHFLFRIYIKSSEIIPKLRLQLFNTTKVLKLSYSYLLGARLLENKQKIPTCINYLLLTSSRYDWLPNRG